MSYIGTIPEPIRIADAQLRRNREQKIKYVPMPTIQSSKTIQGPLHVTEDYKEAYYKKKEAEKKKERADYELELIRQYAKIEKIKAKLAHLDPKDTRDNKSIIALNVKLRNTERKIEEIKEQSGIDFNKISLGGRLQRFWARLKGWGTRIVKKIRKIGKRIRKFYKRHQDPIDGCLIVALPIIAAALFKKVIGFLLGAS